ncbi:MAG: hypothetical protein ACR2N7_04675 [Acidimicrobiia bacterium]
MKRIGLRFLFAYALTVVTVMVVAVPATAGMTAADVWSVVDQARYQNESVLESFTGKALLADTIEELNQARAQAHASLDSTYNAAMNQLDAIAASYPELADDVASAKYQVNRDHDAAHSEVESIYRIVADTLPPASTTTTSTTSTTSTSTSTTTTVPKSTTTSSTVPKSTTTTTSDSTTTSSTPPPRVTTTTYPDATSTSTTIGTTTTTTAAAVVGGSGPGSGTPEADATTSITNAGLDPARTDPPTLEASTATEAATLEATVARMRGDLGAMSGAMELAASTVLPPAIVSFTVAPFIVLEVLFKTVFDSVQALLIPILFLLAAVAVFFWRDTRVRQTPAA